MYIPEFFEIRELVTPEFYEAFKGQGDRMFMAFDARALETLDALRRLYGPITVNDWAWGGLFHQSGLRSAGSGTGATLSQHIFGRAFDCKFSGGVTAGKVRSNLLMWDHLGRREGAEGGVYQHITRIESFPGMSWFHFDVGNHDPERDGILVFGK